MQKEAVRINHNTKEGDNNLPPRFLDPNASYDYPYQQF